VEKLASASNRKAEAFRGMFSRYRDDVVSFLRPYPTIRDTRKDIAAIQIKSDLVMWLDANQELNPVAVNTLATCATQP
jgi:hypothetical protein